MPLKRGRSRETISANIREFKRGETYRRTKSKFGKERADAQAIAVALKMARKSRKRT